MTSLKRTICSTFLRIILRVYNPGPFWNQKRFFYETAQRTLCSDPSTVNHSLTYTQYSDTHCVVYTHRNDIPPSVMAELSCGALCWLTGGAATANNVVLKVSLSKHKWLYCKNGPFFFCLNF